MVVYGKAFLDMFYHLKANCMDFKKDSAVLSWTHILTTVTLVIMLAFTGRGIDALLYLPCFYVVHICLIYILLICALFAYCPLSTYIWLHVRWSQTFCSKQRDVNNIVKFWFSRTGVLYTKQVLDTLCTLLLYSCACIAYNGINIMLAIR